MACYIRSLIALLCCLLAQCGNMDVDERRKPVNDIKPIASSSQQYTSIYQKVFQAQNAEKKSPRLALSYYLDAAHDAYVSRDAKLIPIYNHAVGQVIDLSVQLSQTGGQMPRQFTLGQKTFVLQYPARDHHGYRASQYSDIIPVDCLSIKGWRTHVQTQGVGAPLVVRIEKKSIDSERLKSLPYKPSPSGYTYSLTGLVEFSLGKNQSIATVKLVDPTTSTQVNFWGNPRPLASDLTASFAVSLGANTDARGESVFTLLGVFEPQKLSNNMGIYSIVPIDTNRIPVVLVHGLNSDPATWRNVINELNADPVLRSKYQFLAFYYPTGLPLRVPSAELKRRINHVYRYYSTRGKTAKANQMVIIGHSLGGLLTSAQVRKIDKRIWDKAFKWDVDESLIQSDAMKDYNYLIKGAKPAFVKRVVFISTPHRGSKKADIYLVRLLASLVEIPEKMLVLKVPEAAVALTDFGRSLFGVENPTNSLTVLRSQSAPLELLSKSPIYSHIKYHSIMGDRGRGDTPDSSDGVVSYRSSHLDGAESELIVPAHHSAHDHPMAIKELRRILHEHLGRR